MKLSNTLMMNGALLPEGKKAFTLAEVLITLSILGVVAALTIPSLVNRQSDLAAQVKLKKAISSYEDFGAQYMAETGKASLRDLVNTTPTACSELANYFKIVTEGKDKCNFVTADGAAWSFDSTTGFATVADSAKSPRYAVSLWAQNGQVNGLGQTDSVDNAPAASGTGGYYKTLYTPSGSTTAITLIDSRGIAPAVSSTSGKGFMNGAYNGAAGDFTTGSNQVVPSS
jgi:prepilin-type N-terminal cleavage/methylation domain-containing protein